MPSAYYNPTTNKLISSYIGAAAGSVNVMTVANTDVTVLEDGTVYTVKANLANTTTTPTVNINGLGAKTIVKRVSTALAASDYLANMYLQLLYNGTNMVLLNPIVN